MPTTKARRRASIGLCAGRSYTWARARYGSNRCKMHATLRRQDCETRGTAAARRRAPAVLSLTAMECHTWPHTVTQHPQPPFDLRLFTLGSIREFALSVTAMWIWTSIGSTEFVRSFDIYVFPSNGIQRHRCQVDTEIPSIVSAAQCSPPFSSQ